MEALRKVILIGCLIYGIYGLVSWFELGFFIPPFPIKPILFTVFLIAYILVSRADFSPLLRISLLIWMTSLIFVGQYFVELFFDYRTIDFYLNNIEPFVLMGSLAAFIALVYTMVKEMNYLPYQTIILVGLAALLIPLTILLKDQIVFDYGIITSAFLFFIFDRIRKVESTSEMHLKVLYVMYGVASITFMERITYIF
ncbi:hypothetical protein CW751_08730 [Brumimicrobium salinarum]|uniref:Lysoplasmalogenase n=1 Tax=Brumimicrobium salinarum TaxID=2058658 RepID=A0A2I0R2N4_9FLAO|nr:hypothetical protein [Brumimicrobium salinarum]PKR80842.1 hypothetical protein CW751_08730 [Brumimicrobium salinarum]